MELPYLTSTWHHTVTVVLVLAQPAQLIALHTYALSQLCKPPIGQRPNIFQTHSTRDGLRSVQTASDAVSNLDVNLHITAKPI